MVDIELWQVQGLDENGKLLLGQPDGAQISAIKRGNAELAILDVVPVIRGAEVNVVKVREVFADETVKTPEKTDSQVSVLYRVDTDTASEFYATHNGRAILLASYPLVTPFPTATSNVALAREEDLSAANRIQTGSSAAFNWSVTNPELQLAEYTISVSSNDFDLTVSRNVTRVGNDVAGGGIITSAGIIHSAVDDEVEYTTYFPAGAYGYKGTVTDAGTINFSSTQCDLVTQDIVFDDFVLPFKDATVNFDDFNDVDSFNLIYSNRWGILIDITDQDANPSETGSKTGTATFSMDEWRHRPIGYISKTKNTAYVWIGYFEGGQVKGDYYTITGNAIKVTTVYPAIPTANNQDWRKSLATFLVPSADLDTCIQANRDNIEANFFGGKLITTDLQQNINGQSLADALLATNGTVTANIAVTSLDESCNITSTKTVQAEILGFDAGTKIMGIAATVT